MIERLPESWIPPDHILDLRATVRLRHTLSHQRCEWQQRIQSVLYHHGVPARRQLMVSDGREWLAAQMLPPAAREQVTVFIAMIEALEGQTSPLDRQLRAFARRHAGCKGADGLLRDRGADRGHDPRRARGRQPVLLLARCRALRRAGYHRPPIRSAPLPRPPIPARPARVALGAVRGRAGRASPRQPRPRLLPAGRRERIGGNRACLAVARKLPKRCYHTLRELGEEALQPA
jgi:transposase